MAATKRKLSVSRPLGIVANPASGKDVRRLVARASVFDNQEKRAIVVRALTGAVAAGVRQVRYFNDKHGIAATALSDLAETNSPKIRSKAVDVQPTGVALDTTAAARALKEAGCGAVIVLGGDGTSRAFTQGWRNAVLMPLSTGTNNVFPELLEATVAGTAAGLIATGALGRRAQPEVAKVIDIKIDGERDEQGSRRQEHEKKRVVTQERGECGSAPPDKAPDKNPNTMATRRSEPASQLGESSAQTRRSSRCRRKRGNGDGGGHHQLHAAFCITRSGSAPRTWL